MAEITRKLTANTLKQFFFVIITTLDFSIIAENTAMLFSIEIDQVRFPIMFWRHNSPFKIAANGSCHDSLNPPHSKDSLLG